MRFSPLLVVGLALVGCNAGGLNDARHATGSSSLTTSADYQRVISVNPDAGTVSLIDARAQTKLGEFDVGAEPVRVARAGDLVFVTVRGSGEVVALSDSGDSLSEVGRIAVGADPYGVVADEKGERIFVAVGMAGSVVEIDVESLQIVNSFGGIPGQPRWLALHPSGKSLYVGSAFGGTWSDIDLVTGQVNVNQPPERMRFLFDEMTGEMSEVVLTPRITGDLTVSPYGDTVAIPMLFVDNTTSVDVEDDGPSQTGGYDSGPGVGRTNPTVLLVDTGSSGSPELARQKTIFVQAVRSRVSSGDIETENVRSYLSSLTYSPDGLMVLATMEGSEAVVAVPLNLESQNKGRDEFMDMEGERGFESDPNFIFSPSFAVTTDAGPRGVAFTSRDSAMVDSWLDRTVASMPVGTLQSEIQQRVVSQNLFGLEDLGLASDAGVEASPMTVDPKVDGGRRLFFSATNNSMAAHSGGISCATCHFDGRNDGLTWEFNVGLRQTPSLAGEVSKTEPVTWTSWAETADDVDMPISVSMEVRLTSRNRMGGTGATTQQSYDVQDYIDFTPYPVADASLNADAVTRGRDIFNGSGECSSCHNGAQYTNSEGYAMVGLDFVRTPALRGVAATAPYFHDGRADDLAALVDIAEAVNMGKTNHLSVDEKADLVQFLKSL